MKLSDYIELVRVDRKLSYLKLIPHQNTRNYKSVDIAKLINRCYKDTVKRFYRENGKLFIEEQTKVAYYIYMSAKGGIEFYLIIPTIYTPIFIEKLNYVWEKVEIKVVDDIPKFDESCSKVSLEYTKDDALSLNLADKKSNEVLKSQLNVFDILRDDDKVGIFYNFNYVSSYYQRGFKTNYTKTMDKIKDGKSVDRVRLDSASIFKLIARLFVATIDEITEVLGQILGLNKRDNSYMVQFNKSIGILQKKDLSTDTKDKRQLEVVGTQILLFSQSDNKEGEKMNLNSLTQAFTVLDGDNTLRPRTIGIKRKINLNNTKLPGATNLMSTEEVGNLILQPGKEIINKHKIDSNSINEEEMPAICKDGYIRTGTATRKGKPYEAFLNPNPDQDTGLAITGKQGSGKTEELKNYGYDCINRVYEHLEYGDSLVVLDFIGNNDLANTIQKIVPKNLLVDIDLCNREKMEAIAYPEKYYTDDMDVLDKLDIIAEKSQLMVQLLNSYSYGQDLTSAMRRFFVSACNVVYSVNQYAGFIEIINCLELYDVRMDYINRVPNEFKNLLENQINNLKNLNEKVKSGEDKGEDTGETIDSKIDRILDRVSVMRESPRLDYMLSKDPKENINFEDAFNEGKVILVKMRQDRFGTTHIRNMLTMFFMTRIWEACVNRYSKIVKEDGKKELRRVHFVIDEPHQVPSVTEYLNPLMPQMRKFRLKPVFATQSLQQLSNILYSMKNAGFSYMILAGSDKINFNLLAKDLAPYEVEDLLNLERFHSLNLVPDEKGILKPYITKLPKPVEV